MRLPIRARVVPALALGWLFTACSLMGVQVPDKPPSGEALECGSAAALATVDALTAAAGVAAGLYFLIAPASSECCNAVQVVGIPPLAGGLL
jgi:hypothetical protein